MRLTIHSRARLVLGLVALTIVSLLVFVSGANASGSVTSTVGTVTYTAGSGDGANDVTVDHNALAYTIEDSVAVNASSGCVQVNSTKVSCAGTFGKHVELNTGDGLDNAATTSAVPSTGRVTINGDAGGTNVSSATAAPTTVNSTLGNSFNTGAGPDVLNLGGAGFTASIRTGASADSITFTTNLPKETFDPLFESSPYPNGNSSGGESWPVMVLADEGDDYIDASSSTGPYWYESGSGCDLMIGSSGPDWFNGGSAGSGDDTILAGAGDDTIYSYPPNAGDDMFYGQAGNDKLIVWNNSAEEMFDGGPGMDSIQYQSSGSMTESASVNLDGLKNDGILGNDNWSASVEAVVGPISYVGETLIGNGYDNVLAGSTGPDTITGGSGSDTINGGAGDDTIDAYDGQPDTVNCGDGSDVAEVDASDTVSNCESVTTH